MVPGIKHKFSDTGQVLDSSRHGARCQTLGLKHCSGVSVLDVVPSVRHSVLDMVPSVRYKGLDTSQVSGTWS